MAVHITTLAATEGGVLLLEDGVQAADLFEFPGAAIDDTTISITNTSSLLIAVAIQEGSPWNIAGLGIDTSGTEQWSTSSLTGVEADAGESTYSVTNGTKVFVATSTRVIQFVGATGAASSPLELISYATVVAANAGFKVLYPEIQEPYHVNTIAVAGTTLAILMASSSQVRVVLVNTGTGAISTSATFTTGSSGGYLNQCEGITSDGTSFYVCLRVAELTQVVKVSDVGATTWTSEVLTDRNHADTIGYLTGPSYVVLSGVGISLSLNASTGALVGAGIGADIMYVKDAGSLTITSPSVGTSTVAKPTDILVGVAGGTMKVGVANGWYSVTGGSGLLSSSAKVIRSAESNGKLYFADGASWKQYDPVTNIAGAWPLTAGSFPGSTLSPVGYPRLIVNWRGCIVVSGITGDPRNWFISALNDPTNWDTNPIDGEASTTQAVFGNNSPLGKVGDVITALVPYSDDQLYFGGDHTIYLMSGHPLAGGEIRLVSDAIGMAFGIPWCKDPYGNVYFVSNLCSVFSMNPSSQPIPIRISQRIERRLTQRNIHTTVFRLAWDDQAQGMHLYATDFNQAEPTTHFFWEQRSGAWFTDVFANKNHNPKTITTFAGSSNYDRVVLLGGWDGKVRSFYQGAPNDDGEPIVSHVTIGPLTTKELDLILTKDMVAILGSRSGPVNYAIHIGQSAETALLTAPVRTGVWKANRNTASNIRQSGHAIYLDLATTCPWQYEIISARIATKGKVNRRSGYTTPTTNANT